MYINSMSKELFLKYSTLFPPEDIYMDMTQSCLAFGVECGPGWFPFIEEMLGKLVDLHCEGLKLDQIKEKFGTLRVYYHMEGEYDETIEDIEKKIDAIINEYEDISAKTCDVCGQPGKINESGWLACRCEEHTGKRIKQP
jgi:hypothetical protein